MEQTFESQDWTMVAEIELSYKSKLKVAARPVIASSEQFYDFLRQIWNEDNIDFIEEFKVILLNRACHVLGIFAASTGCSTGTVADPKLIFAAALKANACSIILSHNHPSGNLKPSKADEYLTDRIVQGGKILGINVIDHIIVTSEGYFSFSDEGLM